MGDLSRAGDPDVCQKATWQSHPRKDWLLHSSEAADPISRGVGNSNVCMKDLQIKTGSSTVLPQCSPRAMRKSIYSNRKAEQSCSAGHTEIKRPKKIQQINEALNTRSTKARFQFLQWCSYRISCPPTVKRTNYSQFPSCTCSFFQTHFTGTQFTVLPLLIQLS